MKSKENLPHVESALRHLRNVKTEPLDNLLHRFNHNFGEIAQLLIEHLITHKVYFSVIGIILIDVLSFDKLVCSFLVILPNKEDIFILVT